MFIIRLCLQRNSGSELLKSALITDSLHLRSRSGFGYSRIQIGWRRGRFVTGSISNAGGAGCLSQGARGWFVTKALKTLGLILLAWRPVVSTAKGRLVRGRILWRPQPLRKPTYINPPNWGGSLAPSRSWAYTLQLVCLSSPWGSSAREGNYGQRRGRFFLKALLCAQREGRRAAGGARASFALLGFPPGVLLLPSLSSR